MCIYILILNNYLSIHLKQKTNSPRPCAFIAEICAQKWRYMPRYIYITTIRPLRDCKRRTAAKPGNEARLIPFLDNLLDYSNLDIFCFLNKVYWPPYPLLWSKRTESTMQVWVVKSCLKLRHCELWWYLALDILCFWPIIGSYKTSHKCRSTTCIGN